MRTVRNSQIFIKQNDFVPPLYPKEVNFYDYDGTLLYAYSIAEANALTSLPVPPPHPNLTFYAWNWDLAEVQTLDHIADIGAEYNTTDGKTYLYVDIPNDENSMVSFYAIGRVSWGDGSPSEMSSGDISHTYNPSHFPAQFVIVIDGNGSGNVSFYGDSSINVKCILFGANCINTFSYSPIGAVAWSRLNFGASVCIDKPIPFFTYPKISNLNIMGSQNLRIAFPKSISTQVNVRLSSTSLSACLPHGLTSLIYNGNENSLKRIYLPETLQTLGNSATGDIFSKQHSLQEVKFPKILSAINGRIVHEARARIKMVLDFSSHESVPSLTFSRQYSFADSTIVKVPSALLAEWKASEGWNSFESLIIGV